MDGREGMALQGSASYYLNRGGIGGSASSGPGHNVHHGGGSAGGMHGGLPVFRTPTNPNIPVQPGVQSGPSFHVENPTPNFPHGMGMAVVSGGGGGGGGGDHPVKKKRGRPRKYAPDGANMSLGLSTMPASKPSSSSAAVLSPGEKGRRGRPPGTGWKQKLAPLGEWMNSSAGLAFAPHVLHIAAGEDVAAKILAFAQQRPRALCIMSANGSVSSVTLRQPTNSGATITYEGRFEILCLSGSYLVAESGGPHNRTGGISISICSPDGHIIGGAIGGRLVAATPVQVVACSFVYGNTKAKTKAESETKDERYLLDQSAEKSMTPGTGASSHSYTPNSGPSVWPPGSRSQTDIDLMRG